MHVRERSPRINEHRSRKHDASAHCEKKPCFDSLCGEVLLVQVLLIKVGKDAEEGRYTKKKREGRGCFA